MTIINTIYGGGGGGGGGEYQVFGTGADGDCTICYDAETNGNVFLEAKVYNFNNLTICENVKLRFCGEGVPILRVKNNFVNDGCVILRNPLLQCCGAYADPYIMETISNCCNQQYSSANSLWQNLQCSYLYGACAAGGAACSGNNYGKGGNGGSLTVPAFNGCDVCGYSGGQGGASGTCSGGGGGQGARGGGAGANGCNGGNCVGGNGGGAYNSGVYGSGGGGGFGWCGGGGGGHSQAGAGGNGGNAIVGNGGSGGASLNFGRGGNGGCSYWGNGGAGGCSCYCIGGKGGCSILGNGGSGGAGRYTCCQGNAGSSLYGDAGSGCYGCGINACNCLGSCAWNGAYGFGLFAKSILNRGYICGKGGDGYYPASGSKIYMTFHEYTNAGTINCGAGTGGGCTATSGFVCICQI